MILHYDLVRALHQQRLEEAARKEPELRMIREVDSGRRSWKGQFLRLIRRRLSRSPTNRSTLNSCGRVSSARWKPTHMGCMDDPPDELSCRAA